MWRQKAAMSAILYYILVLAFQRRRINFIDVTFSNDTRFNSFWKASPTGSIVVCAASSTNVLYPVWWRSEMRQPSRARPTRVTSHQMAATLQEKSCWYKVWAPRPNSVYLWLWPGRILLLKKAERLFTAAPLILCLRGQTEGPWQHSTSL